MTIKARELAYLKTSGEVVFVLQYPNGEGRAVVRRPVMGRDGVQHETNIFDYDELETLSEQRKRVVSEHEELIAKYVPSKTTPDPDSGFFSN